MQPCSDALVVGVATTMAGVAAGADTEGKVYGTVAEMWRHELQGDVDDPNDGWYGKAIEYWRTVTPTIDGVLGGLSHVHQVDVLESAQFLADVAVGRERALDCGAGIGRVTKTLIAPLGFKTIDLVEPLGHMLDVARKEVDSSVAGEFYETSLQKLVLDHDYDLIAVQWVAIYLTDDDLIAFVKQCREHLRPGGVIFFKENCSSDDKFLVDKDDSSLTRSDRHYRSCFEAAGASVVKHGHQRNWERDLIPVAMYAVQ